MHLVPNVIYPLGGVLALALLAQASSEYQDDTLPTFPYGANGIKAPVTFPLSNGYPNIANNTDAWNALTIQAHGSISNAPPPPSFAPDDLESMKVVHVQETFEVYYWTQLMQNITNNVPGYEIADAAIKKDVLEKMCAIQAEEMWHSIQAGAIIEAYGGEPIKPCVFKAPVTDLAGAMALASNFTGLVISTLQDVATRMGRNGDVAVIGGVVSIVGNEAKQAGWMRTTFGDYLSADQPYMTASTREYAYSALQQNFIVSCPNTDTINVPIYDVLTVVTTNIQPQDQTLTFSIAAESTEGLWMAYINQQNMPVVVEISNPTTKDGVTTFEVNYPYTQQQLFGLTIAALVNSTGPFITAADVAAVTQYGPGLIYPN